jgi:hypothetical protein
MRKYSKVTLNISEPGSLLKGLAIDRHWISETSKISPNPEGIRGMLGMKEIKGFQVLKDQLSR